MCLYLTKRNATYYFRRKIPDDLQPFFEGATEFTFSLRTKDKEEAKQRRSVEALRTDREFAEARAALASEAAQEGVSAHPETPLSEAEQEEAEFQARMAEEAVERRRLRRPKRDEFRRRMAYSTERLSSTEQVARDLLRDKEELVRELEAQLRERETAGVERTVARSAEAERRSAMLDTTIVDLWAAERKVSAKGKDTHRAVARWFYERVGSKPVHEITRKDVLAFKDKLIEEGQSPANINMKLSRLRTLLQWAADNDYAEANVAAGVKIKDTDAARNKRKVFDLASLNAIFLSPVFSQGVRPAAGKGEAAYWLPLLALFTGARLEELGQLRPSDVTQISYPDAEGADRTGWFIRITDDEAEDLKIKNAASERLVPVHPELERLGFIRFAQAALAAGDARLFPKLKANIYGRLTAKWGEWFSVYLRTVCGVTDKRMVFHSFRHTYKDYARHAGILEGVQKQIMGHSAGDVAGEYGSGYSLHQLVEGMKLYKVPGLKLS